MVAALATGPGGGHRRTSRNRLGSALAAGNGDRTRRRSGDAGRSGV
jgi:hypothetical protein